MPFPTPNDQGRVKASGDGFIEFHGRSRYLILLLETKCENAASIMLERVLNQVQIELMTFLYNRQGAHFKGHELYHSSGTLWSVDFPCQGGNPSPLSYLNHRMLVFLVIGTHVRILFARYDEGYINFLHGVGYANYRDWMQIHEWGPYDMRTTGKKVMTELMRYLAESCGASLG